MGAWSSATDGYDDGLDFAMAQAGDGFAGMYHEKHFDDWGGPAGFYHTDYRAYPADSESTTWSSLYLWAAPTFTLETMQLSVDANPAYLPPADRSYTLTLLDTPAGLIGAPSTGTQWAVPLSGVLTITVPTFRTTDGTTGYLFSFTIGPTVPEPAMAALLGFPIGFMVRRRSRRARR